MFGGDFLSARRGRFLLAILAVVLFFNSSRRFSYTFSPEDQAQSSRRPRPARQDVPRSPLRAVASAVSAGDGKAPRLLPAAGGLAFPGSPAPAAFSVPLRLSSEMTKPHYLQFYLSSTRPGELSPPA
jgi:hypothetical protein